MTHGDLVERLYRALDDEMIISRQQVREVLNFLRMTIIAGLIEDGRVNLEGLGVFTVRESKARRHNLTGKMLPAHKRVHFQAGTKLKRSLRTLTGEEF